MKTEEKKAHINERQLVVFSLATEEFGIEIKKVNSIIKTEKITKIPNSEFYVEGVINLRGKIIVVVNLHKKLGLAEKGWDKDTRIIVVELAEETVGMIVDSVREVLRIEEDKIEEAPQIILDKIDSDYIEGVGILNERLIIILEVDKVLHKQELDKIKNISGKAGETKEEMRKDPQGEEKKEEKEEEKKDGKPVIDASPDSYFWFNNGKAAKNLSELADDLKKIDGETFKHHVNGEKNDFAAWIRNVMKDEALAEKIKTKTTKEEIISILNSNK